MMGCVKWVFLACSVSCFFVSFFFLAVHFAFQNAGSTAQTIARSVKKKSKKDVPVYGRRHPGLGPISQVMTIKDQTTGVYIYEVNGRHYKKRYRDHVTSKQMPDTVTICYLKRCPGIGYVVSDVLAPGFLIGSLAWLMIALVSVIGSLQAFFLSI